MILISKINLIILGRYPGSHDALYRNALYPGSRDPSALSSKYPLGGGIGERLTQSHLEDKERGRQFMHEQVRHLYTEQVIKNKMADKSCDSSPLKTLLIEIG